MCARAQNSYTMHPVEFFLNDLECVSHFRTTRYFDMPSPVPYGPPVIEDSCGYLTAGTYAIFNSAGAPASITAPLRKCKWQPLSIRVNAA